MTPGITRSLMLLTFVFMSLAACTIDRPATISGLSTWTDHDRVRMEQLRDTVTDMRAMLEDYYGGALVLDYSWYLPLEHPSRQQGVEFLAAKFARAIVWQEPLVIGTIGSSVLAGHDNCRYDCYQQQLQRLLGPVMASAGSRLEVRNTGQGGDCGDSFDNQVWCLPMLAGADIDIAHYSWTYFEAGGRERVPVAHEMFYRWSLMMEHSPVPQLIYANNCPNLQKGDKALLDAYAPFGTDILCMTRGLAELGYERRDWGSMGDPLHATTREGVAAGTSDVRKKSLAVMYRNWHPGPLLFQTTADVLAWRYSEALLLALEWIGVESNPRSRWPRKPAKLQLADLPAPLECPEQWCNVEGPPVCINFEQPVFGKPQVELLGALDRGWVFDPGQAITQRAIPAEEKHLPACTHPNRCSGWRVPPGQQSGNLSFSLPDLKLGMVAVCCGSKGCGEKLLDAGARFLLDDQPLASPAVQHWANKCVQVQARFPEPSTTGRTLRLDITLPLLEEPLPPITHVFGL
jgi:hypothetical protein